MLPRMIGYGGWAIVYRDGAIYVCPIPRFALYGDTLGLVGGLN